MTMQYFKWSFLTGAVVVLLFLSCKKEEGLLPEDHRPPTAQQNFVAAFTENGDENSVDVEDLDILCFEMQYPIAVNFPDGSQQTFHSDSALYSAIDDWYDQNPDSDEDPAIVFPITVVLEDGSSAEIVNDEELCDLFFECYAAWEDEEAWEDFEEEEWEEECDEFEEACFEIQFPLNIRIGDSVYTFQSWDDADSVVYELIDDLDEGEEIDIEIVFPITVILEDGELLVINNEIEFENQEESCLDEEDCLTIVYPININFPDGSSQKVNSDDELDRAIEDWERANPKGEEEDILPDFPLDVLDRDGLVVTVENLDQLEKLEDACEDDAD